MSPLKEPSPPGIVRRSVVVCVSVLHGLDLYLYCATRSPITVPSCIHFCHLFCQADPSENKIHQKRKCITVKITLLPWRRYTERDVANLPLPRRERYRYRFYDRYRYIYCDSKIIFLNHRLL
jgi:hypothetical protein